MIRWLANVVSAGAMLAVFGGCHRAAPLVLQQPVSITELAAGAPEPDEGYQLLVEQATTGRFPCGLAIARLAPIEDETGRHVVLSATRPNEEARWTEALRGMVTVRELLFLAPRGAAMPSPDIAEMLRSARQLDAALLLVYAPTRTGPNSADVIGVVYDTRNQAALASLHARDRVFDDDGVERAPAARSGDQRDTDAASQATRAFERYTVATLEDLLRRDSPPPSTQPSRWEAPREDRWWLPTIIRHR